MSNFIRIKFCLIETPLATSEFHIVCFNSRSSTLVTVTIKKQQHDWIYVCRDHDERCRFKQLFLRSFDTWINHEIKIPCNRIALSGWEHNNSILLPEDLREFYSSVDGFKITWTYKENKSIVGCISINSLCELKKIKDFCTNDGEIIESRLLLYSKDDRLKSKYDPYIISNEKGVGYVCIIFTEINNETLHGIWLLDLGYQWHFLASNFSCYFRMALVHMGLPQWQLRFTPMDQPPSSKRLLFAIAPHLIEDQNNKQQKQETHRNNLNTNLFKNITSKQNKQK